MSLSCRLALSTSGKLPDEAVFAEYAESGIKAMEVSVRYELCEALDFGELKRLSEHYGVTLWSFHLPFMPFDRIDISNPELADYSVELMKGYMKKASEIGINVFIVHASGEPIDDTERNERMACAKKSLHELAEFADALGATVAVEDLPRSCLGRNSKEISELISAHKRLAVCFDTNHLLGESPIEFIKNTAGRIITLHVSDYDRINERHWLPGEGVVDWQELIQALDAVGYKGYWLYELGLETPWSIDRQRKLKYSDIKENYDALMCGKTPKPFGTPKRNLGMWEN